MVGRPGLPLWPLTSIFEYVGCPLIPSLSTVVESLVEVGRRRFKQNPSIIVYSLAPWTTTLLGPLYSSGGLVIDLHNWAQKPAN